MDSLINQKLRAKQYKHLNGKYIECFIGRIYTTYKMVLHDVSLTEEVNQYGSFKPAKAKIINTAFNGKSLQLILEARLFSTHTLALKIPVEEIDNLTIHDAT